MNKILYSILAIVFSLLTTVFIYNYYEDNKPRDVSIIVNNDNVSFGVFKPSENDAHGGALAVGEELVASFTGSSSIELSPGSYAVIPIEGNQEYKRSASSLVVAPHDENKLNISLAFTDKKLQELIQQESGNIDSSIKNHFRNFSSTRNKIQDVELYLQGEWASAVITTNEFYDDYFHVVLNKQEGSWKVVTKPQITLSLTEYPDIPSEVLDTVNNKLFTRTGERV